MYCILIYGSEAWSWPHLVQRLDVRQQTAEFGRGGSTVYLPHHQRHVGFIQGIDECRKGNHSSLSQKQSTIQSQQTNQR